VIFGGERRHRLGYRVRLIDRTLVRPHELVKSLMLAPANSLDDFGFAFVGLCARATISERQTWVKARSEGVAGF
jgi:hypothetical protein